MGQLDLISRPRADKGRSYRLRAFVMSLLFHGVAFGCVLGLAFAYRSHLLPPKSGSAPGSPSISIEKMVIVSSPAQPPPPPLLKTATVPPVPDPIVADSTPLRESEAQPAPPEATVPVLALRSSKPAQKTPVKTQAAIHPASSTTATAKAQSLSKPAAATSVSSYAPGVNILPHPPYPLEARDRGQTGTVIMNVKFDAGGGVALAEVAQSSGVPILDSETRSFIRAHWHSPSYAGQTLSVPVQYTLQKL
jgi:periplasmic protein TonB